MNIPKELQAINASLHAIRASLSAKHSLVGIAVLLILQYYGCVSPRMDTFDQKLEEIKVTCVSK